MILFFKYTGYLLYIKLHQLNMMFPVMLERLLNIHINRSKSKSEIAIDSCLNNRIKVYDIWCV